MPDIGSKVTHVIQSNEKGVWKNATKHEGLADAQSFMNQIPKQKRGNYRIRTLAQAGLTRDVDRNKVPVKKSTSKTTGLKKVASVAKNKKKK